MAVATTAERQQQAEDDFLNFDADGSGTIDEEELLALFEKLIGKISARPPKRDVLTEYMRSFRTSPEVPLDLEFDAFVKVYNSFLTTFHASRPVLELSSAPPQLPF